MIQADIIREHALECHVEVARRAHQKTLTIVSGKVEQELRSRNKIPENRLPNICQALKGRKFLEMAGVRLLKREGPKASTTTCFHYAIEDSSPSSARESQREPIRASHSRPLPGPAPTRSRLTTADRPEKEYSAKTLEISPQFNVCVLGEVAGKDLARKKLQGFFSKHGLKATEWEIEFISSRKLKNWDVLKKLKKGQSKFNLLVTGQIHHHSGKGNESANLLTELKKAKYVEHIVGSSPKDVLTVDSLVEKLEKYLTS